MQFVIFLLLEWFLTEKILVMIHALEGGNYVNNIGGKLHWHSSQEL